MSDLLISFDVDDNMHEDDPGFEYKGELCSFFSSNIQFTYTENCTIRDMLDFICKSAPYDPNSGFSDQGLVNRFILVVDGAYKNFQNIDTNLKFMLSYINSPQRIHLSVTIGYPGGGVGVGDFHGIRFFINSNESNHMGRAHVHAEYADYSASYDILNGSKICGNLPKKQDKLAQKAIRENTPFLLHEWNEYSNGFRISQNGYCYDSLQKKMKFADL